MLLKVWHEILCFMPVILVVLLIGIVICLFCRRQRNKRKVYWMDPRKKLQMLKNLTEPFGFTYQPKRDIFVSCINAWQRKEGYEALYDNLASNFNMIFDAWPVYFNYRNKTWLIEFWKGQYGINTGCEVGVYHTNREVPKMQQRFVHYNAASDDEMPLIQFCLEKNNRILFSYENYHWWLAAFRMGEYSKPKQLTQNIRISFRDPKQAEAFYQGLLESGFPQEKCCLQYHTVYAEFDFSKQYTGMKCLKRKLVQMQNRWFCRLYRIVTRPFTNTVDRMMFLYFELPYCFRHMMQLHCFGRRKK